MGEQEVKQGPFGYVDGSYSDILAKLEWISVRTKDLGTSLVAAASAELIDFGVLYCQQAKQFLLEQEYAREIQSDDLVKLAGEKEAAERAEAYWKLQVQEHMATGETPEFLKEKNKALRRQVTILEKRNTILRMKLDVAEEQVEIANLEAQLEDALEFGYFGDEDEEDIDEVIAYTNEAVEE